ncbi:hypothetical protein MMC17_007908 [Xylographa soralifera]|nr:hypothetical protein [Xylographa soralifera]
MSHVSPSLPVTSEISGNNVQTPKMTSFDESMSSSRCAVVVSTGSDPIGVVDGSKPTDSRDGSMDHEDGSSGEDDASAPGSDEEMFDDEDAEDEEDGEEDSDVDYNESEEWPWLKTFSSDVKSDVDGKLNQQIASCKAWFIDREPIRSNFYTEMEEPVQDLSDLAFTVFDRWGCLKTEIKDHPIKKGSGVWGNEIDEGRILVIETLEVDKSFRRQGVAKKLFEDLWLKVKSSETDCRFAMVWATHLNNSEDRIKMDEMSTTESHQYFRSSVASVVSFWRAMGFRRIGTTQWFCLAADVGHPAAKLSAQDDFNLPERIISFSPLPLHDALDAINNPKPREDNTRDFLEPELAVQRKESATLELLNGYLSSHSSTDIGLNTSDRDGNTLLHLLAKPDMLKPLQWVFQRLSYTCLLNIRNHEGDTPAEALASKLEKKRTQLQFNMMVIHVADRFQGYSNEEVECLLKLRGVTNPSDMDKARATFGCTCGMCLGYISPRISFALEAQADVHHDMSNDMFEDGISGEQWVRWNEYKFQHVAPRVLQNLKTNKSMRQGVTNLFRHVADCIRQKQIPTTLNVLHVLENAGEWPPCTKSFLQRGGTVTAVVLQCFDFAMSQDCYLGDGYHEEVFQDDIDKLPVCRNDRELLFAKGMYTMLEGGHPGTSSPRVKRAFEDDGLGSPSSLRQRMI